jgi:hypothetical protein
MTPCSLFDRYQRFGQSRCRVQGSFAVLGKTSVVKLNGLKESTTKFNDFLDRL